MERIKYLLLFAAIALVGCQVSDEEDSLIGKRKNKVEEVAYARAFKVGVTPTMDCLPIFLLKDSNLYNPDNIDIRLKEYSSQLNCDTAMQNGRVQASVTDLIRAEYLKEEKHIVLDYMTETNATWQLLASPQSGVKKPEDLGNKIIGLTFNSIMQYLTIRVFSGHDISSRFYGSQINDIFIRLKMLNNNQIDAIWTSEPQTTQAKLLGNREIYSSVNENFIPGAIVYVNNPKIEHQRAFEVAYNKAVDILNSHSIQYFAPLIKKYMKVDDKVVAALPKITYKRVIAPRERAINKARNILP